MVYLSRPYPFKFLEAVFHKFYLVHPWILTLPLTHFFFLLPESHKQDLFEQAITPKFLLISALKERALM